MAIDNQLILMLSALGAINGALVAIYLLLKQSTIIANRFLGAMLVMISIRTFKSVLFYFNPDIDKEILQVGLSACFLIGPFLYFFCLSQVDKLQRQWLDWRIHLGGLILLVCGFGITYPYAEHELLWQTTVFRFINWSWLVYLLLSFVVIIPVLRSAISRRTYSQSDIWLGSIFLGNAVVWLAYFTSSYTSYIVGALSFSFVLLVMFLLIVFRGSVVNPKAKYNDKKIDQAQAQALIEKLRLLMIEEEVYKNSLITLPQLAKRLGVSTPKLSQLLNDNLQQSFTHFINEYRINAAKELLTADIPMKMETIAEQCGFNSQSTFYSAFKRYTRVTPAKYKLSK